MKLVDFRFWPKADVQKPMINVRLSGQSRRGADIAECLLLTQSRHHVVNFAVTHNTALIGRCDRV
jgi:hypothetical protein